MTEQQFLWDWWLKFATTLATIGALLVALFGSWLRATLLPPRLRIRLAEAKVDIILARVKLGNEAETIVASRWYHIRVENERRGNPVAGLQVFVLRLEKKDAAGIYTPFWR